MNKDAVVGMVSIIVVLIAVVAYALLHPMPAQAPSEMNDASTTPSGTYIEHAAYYDIETTYATSTPLSSISPSANAAATALMQKFVMDTVAQFKLDGNFANLTQEDVQMMGFDQGRKEVLQIVYLTSSSAHTVSYIYTIYEDTLGAHGNTFFRTFTFDTTTAKSLALADVFRSGTDYLQKLSAISRTRLPGILGDAADTATIASGTTANAQNFENFFFDNGDFVLIFPPYQVAAYAAGPQTLRIPLADLASILKPDYR
jgi:peptidoglycan-N-acetylglucosamine deacetylase